MTAIEYRKKHKDLQEQIVGLEARIRNRLLELAKQYPDVIIGRRGDTMIKAKSISNEYYINSAPIEDVLETIQGIEQWLANQHQHQQGKLFN